MYSAFTLLHILRIFKLQHSANPEKAAGKDAGTIEHFKLYSALKTENDELENQAQALENMAGSKKEKSANKLKAESIRKQKFAERFINVKYEYFKAEYEEYEQRKKSENKQE
ncbi:hypothetical protein [Longitalea arenae]|uniref:hypothetical protein n=1 Tax=Longitalea arenae TaxID=2812558 RepID=UPI0019683060|nr:hypothetical protein [Longitalea arenae]